MNIDLYLVFFGLLALIDIILFHWGLFTLLLAKGETDKMLKARRLLTSSLILFFIIFLLFLVFYAVSYFLQKGDVFVSTPEVLGEFPYPYHISPFPAGPEFIKLGRYYFSGPILLEKSRADKVDAIYAVLCKKDQEYDMLYISEGLGSDLLKHDKYSCWSQNCSQLYLSYFLVSSDNYDKKKEVKESLIRQFNPLCSDSLGSGQEL